MNAPQSDKQPLRVHLESQWRQTGVMPDLLRDRPPLPPLAAHVWKWFIELHNDRDSGEFGAKRISHRDVTEWADAYGVRLNAWERRAIRKLDAAYLAPQTNAEDEEA